MDNGASLNTKKLQTVEKIMKLIAKTYQSNNPIYQRVKEALIDKLGYLVLDSLYYMILTSIPPSDKEDEEAEEETNSGFHTCCGGIEIKNGDKCPTCGSR